MACRYTCIKKHSSFSFMTLLFMPGLIENEPSGAFGMLKAGVHLSGDARYHNCYPSAIQYLKDCYQATRTVKG